jgi:predicted RNase H-like nuclease (RuvC/YqgF family)
MKYLSPREQEIEALLADGYDNEQIAHKLHLSVRSVDNVISRVHRKSRSREFENYLDTIAGITAMMRVYLKAAREAMDIQKRMSNKLAMIVNRSTTQQKEYEQLLDKMRQVTQTVKLAATMVGTFDSRIAKLEQDIEEIK